MLRITPDLYQTILADLDHQHRNLETKLDQERDQAKYQFLLAAYDTVKYIQQGVYLCEEIFAKELYEKSELRDLQQYAVDLSERILSAKSDDIEIIKHDLTVVMSMLRSILAPVAIHPAEKMQVDEDAIKNIVGFSPSKKSDPDALLGAAKIKKTQLDDAISHGHPHPNELQDQIKLLNGYIKPFRQYQSVTALLLKLIECKHNHDKSYLDMQTFNKIYPDFLTMETLTAYSEAGPHKKAAKAILKMIKTELCLSPKLDLEYRVKEARNDIYLNLPNQLARLDHAESKLLQDARKKFDAFEIEIKTTLRNDLKTVMSSNFLQTGVSKGEQRDLDKSNRHNRDTRFAGKLAEIEAEIKLVKEFITYAKDEQKKYLLARNLARDVALPSKTKQSDSEVTPRSSVLTQSFFRRDNSTTPEPENARVPHRTRHKP